MEEKIEVLAVEAGQKFNPETGEGAIASLGGLRGFQGDLVFLPRLPKAVKVGSKVRVALEEIQGKKDARGCAMWRAKPAPDFVEEVWEQQDGDLVRKVAIRRNWVFAEIRRETLEERPAQKRDGLTHETYEAVALLGESLAESSVLEAKVRLVYEEQEVVENGQLLWRRAGERREPIADFEREVVRVTQAGALSSWDWKKPDWTGLSVTLSVEYKTDWKRSASQEETYKVNSAVLWEELPCWLQSQIQAPYALCACARQRYEEQADGYGKCELCRAEEVCERCGRSQAKVELVYGKLICEACKPQAALELMVEAVLLPRHRQRIADEAIRLRSGQLLKGPEGEVILGATMDYIADYCRGDLLRQWSGYGWYCFAEAGTFGTKFASAALDLLGYLPQASGNGLLELVAWIAGDVKPSPSDYYLRTQVNGEQGIKPSFTEDRLNRVVDKLEANEPVLADWLRGSEADRQQATRELSELSDATGRGEYHEALQEAKSILQDRKQDYALALVELAKAREVIAGEQRLYELLERDYPVCPLCGLRWRDRDGEEVYPTSGVSCDCPPVAGEKQAWKDFPVMRSVASDGRVLVTADLKYGIFRYGYVEVTVVITVVDWAAPELGSVKTERLMDLPQLEAAQRQLAMEGKIASELAHCEGEHPSRVKCEFVADPGRPGKLYADARLATEMTAFDKGGNSHQFSVARFVCDPSRCSWLSDERPLAGQTWVCSLGKVISQTNSRLIIVVNPQVRVDNISLSTNPVGEEQVASEGDATVGDLAAKWGGRVREETG